CEVLARTRNTARRGKATLDLEMTLVFRLRDGRVSAIHESVDDLSAWKEFGAEGCSAPWLDRRRPGQAAVRSDGTSAAPNVGPP
ncbi:MAG TPA: hypothetical protein VGH93_00575, partial [Solirubrobacteraceae bacterium]